MKYWAILACFGAFFGGYYVARRRFVPRNRVMICRRIKRIYPIKGEMDSSFRQLLEHNRQKIMDLMGVPSHLISAEKGYRLSLAEIHSRIGEFLNKQILPIILEPEINAAQDS